MVRFKLYDKVQESIKRGTTRFWRSVWNIPDGEIVDVARFEWTVKVYEANFTEIQYLSDYTFPRLKELLNYASLKWGRLCIPDPEDSNQSRWQLTPLWEAVIELIDGWSLSEDWYAVRRYDLRPDMSLAYLKFIAGSLGGFMARVGIEQGAEIEATLDEALDLLKDKGLSVDERAKKKWELYIRLLGARKQ